MRNKQNIIIHITGSIARTLLAVTFLFSGFVKAVDPLGTVYKIEDYLKAFGGFFTDFLPIAGVAAVVLIATEWILGWTMFFNIRTKLTSWLSLLFYLFMTPLTLWIALNNPISDCGCFGDALVLTNWQTFWKNVILLSLVIILLCCKKAIPQLFSWWAELIIFLLGIGVAAGVMSYSYTHLPPIDFRPYKVGNHIPTLMESEVAPVYEHRFIYEKDGVQQEFSKDDCPSKEDGWAFIDRKDILVTPGSEAPIHDFEITTMDGEEITLDILESEEPVTLVTMYDLNKTNRSQMSKVLALYQACEERGEWCYLLTGSGEDDIYAFAESIGMDVETAQRAFCMIDPVTLKTIVRANPGMFVIQNGTIIEKHNFKQL